MNEFRRGVKLEKNRVILHYLTHEKPLFHYMRTCLFVSLKFIKSSLNICSLVLFDYWTTDVDDTYLVVDVVVVIAKTQRGINQHILSCSTKDILVVFHTSCNMSDFNRYKKHLTCSHFINEEELVVSPINRINSVF